VRTDFINLAKVKCAKHVLDERTLCGQLGMMSSVRKVIGFGLALMAVCGFVAACSSSTNTAPPGVVPPTPVTTSSATSTTNTTTTTQPDGTVVKETTTTTTTNGRVTQKQVITSYTYPTP